MAHNAGLASDTVKLSLIVPSEARTGRRMRAVARLTNAAGRPLDLYLRGRSITIDIVATRPDGQHVWRLLEEEMIPAIIQHVRLAAGESLDVPITWRWTLAEGAYRLQALLLTEGEPVAGGQVPLQLRR